MLKLIKLKYLLIFNINLNRYFSLVCIYFSNYNNKYFNFFTQTLAKYIKKKSCKNIIWSKLIFLTLN